MDMPTAFIVSLVASVITASIVYFRVNAGDDFTLPFIIVAILAFVSGIVVLYTSFHVLALPIIDWLNASLDEPSPLEWLSLILAAVSIALGLIGIVRGGWLHQDSD